MAHKTHKPIKYSTQKGQESATVNRMNRPDASGYICNPPDSPHTGAAPNWHFCMVWNGLGGVGTGLKNKTDRNMNRNGTVRIVPESIKKEHTWRSRPKVFNAPSRRKSPAGPEGRNLLWRSPHHNIYS